MPGQEGIGAKTCVVCGKDAAGLPRVKDAQGRYYHKQCREAAKRKLAAQGAAPVTSSPTAPKGPRVASGGARLAAPPPRVPAAVPVSPARPVVRSAAKTEPVDAGPDLLDELSSLESAAPSVEAGFATMCPGCSQTLPGGAVICVACGFSLKTGARMTAAAVAVPRAKPAKKGKSGRSGESEGKAFWLCGGIPALILLALFFLSRNSVRVAFLFLAVHGFFWLGLKVWILVKAFGNSPAWGIVCLCLPFTSIYFVFAKTEDAKLKSAYAAYLMGSILAFFVENGVSILLPGYPGLPSGP